jgi:hypothetical protein
VEGDGLASATAGPGFDSSPCPIIPLGEQVRISSKLKGIKRPAQSDVALAMRVAESTEGPS